MKRRYPPAYATFALMIGVALAIASLAVDTGTKTQIVRLGPGDDAALDDSGVGTVGPGVIDGQGQVSGPGRGGGGGSVTRQVVAGQKATGPVACAPGRNGGATDVGVTGKSIKLGATIVQSGIGASFLGDVRFAMQAVVNKTNAAGGVCGRRLDLKLVDDGWSFDRGNIYLRNLVEDDKVFALAVVPSSEGLKSISDADYLKQQKVPAVGTDGMLQGQYTDPFIWPVAASTVSTMHIMFKQAWDAGARDFGLVYESSYHFGIEGAYAYNAGYRRMTNSDIDGYHNPLVSPKCELKFCAVNGDADSYGGEIETFNKACNVCDFVGLLLEPTTATKWMKGGGLRPRDDLRMGGVQPLFTYDFGSACGASCNGVWLWTGYTPPIGDFLGIPAVSTYVNDIKNVSSSADYNNQFVLGGYVGMELMVKALQTAGPSLTRAALKDVLDHMTFDSGGLAPVLSWSAGHHFANVRMHAYSMQYKGGFNGWRDEQVVLEDPWIGEDLVKK